MANVEYRYLVTSEVHQAMKPDDKAKPIVSPENTMSRFSFKYPDNSNLTEANGCKVDDDGDLVVCRRSDIPLKEEVIAIEHSFSTTLDLVGRQIWRGALLLGDFLIHHGSKLLQDHTVLELGSGVGLTSIVAAMHAAEVICTDIDVGGILDLIKGNASRNSKLVKANFVVLGLNFFEKDWSPILESKLTKVTMILVADVIYDNEVTEAFINTLEKLLTIPPAKTVYIALEKRYVFTIDDLNSVAPCYEFFLQCLRRVTTKPPGSLWDMEQMEINFPQYFDYERVKELVLWRISSEKKSL